MPYTAADFDMMLHPTGERRELIACSHCGYLMLDAPADMMRHIDACQLARAAQSLRIAQSLRTKRE